jgi:large subunit ribosomal protein L24
MANVNVKTGDTVAVIAGKDAGKVGKVLVVTPKTNKVVVEGVNIIKKAHKARSAQDKSEIKKQEAGIDVSNVMVICPKCGKATRVKHQVIDGKKVRVCKCGASLDEKPATKKVAKKTAEKAVEATDATETAPKAEKPVAKKTTTAKKTTKSAETSVKATKAATTKKTTTTGKSSQRGV